MTEVTTFIVDSFLKNPKEWTFDGRHKLNYVKHASGFELSLYDGNPEVFSPDWAKQYKFSPEEKEVLWRVIQPLQKQHREKGDETVGPRIIEKLKSKRSLEKNVLYFVVSAWVIISSAVVIVAALT